MFHKRLICGPCIFVNKQVPAISLYFSCGDMCPTLQALSVPAVAAQVVVALRAIVALSVPASAAQVVVALRVVVALSCKPLTAQGNIWGCWRRLEHALGIRLTVLNSRFSSTQNVSSTCSTNFLGVPKTCFTTLVFSMSPKPHQCSQHQFSTMSSNTPTASL